MRVAMDDSKRLDLITEAVRYCQRMKALGMPLSCYTKALREPVHFLWEIKDGPKIKVAKYRSRASLGLKYGKGELVYDHAVPFRYLQAELLALDPITPQAVRAALERFNVAVIITREENAILNARGFGRAMPSDWDGEDPLARYNAAGIFLVDNRTLVHDGV